LGEIFTHEAFRIASPGQGLAPYKLAELLGKKANRNIPMGEFLFESDLKDSEIIARQFKFPIKWGVPVRYHDFEKYKQWIKPDLFEFHLSYRDLLIDPTNYLSRVNCTRLVVHAPELFENSELLDLVSDDFAYRKRSIQNMQRVVSATLKIAEYFPKADALFIVGNVGGYSADEPRPVAVREELYMRYKESCDQIKFSGTELIPQNMAPFPWHFGGQRHQNIFMMPDDLIEKAKTFNIRYCLDLSHLQMTCNHFGLDFQEWLEKLLPYTIHLHIADAKGTNGEGVEMGTGDISWKTTWEKVIAQPNVSFIPEIWQGHKDHGEGFWNALKQLSQLD
jgi:N-acetylneuraminate synthase